MASTTAELPVKPTAKTCKEPVSTGAKPRRPVNAIIDYDKALELKLAGKTFTEIAQLLCVNRNSLIVGFSRKKLSQVVREKVYGRPNADKLEQYSKDARTALAHEVVKQTNALSSSGHVTYSDLPSSKDGQGRADVVRKIADTAATVFGWDAESRPSIVAIGLVGQWDSTQDALDVSSSVADATAGSGAEQQQIEQGPQEEQQPKP